MHSEQLRFDQIYCSPFLRTRQTAAIILSSDLTKVPDDSQELSECLSNLHVVFEPGLVENLVPHQGLYGLTLKDLIAKMKHLDDEHLQKLELVFGSTCLRALLRPEECASSDSQQEPISTYDRASKLIEGLLVNLPPGGQALLITHKGPMSALIHCLVKRTAEEFEIDEGPVDMSMGSMVEVQECEDSWHVIGRFSGKDGTQDA